MDIGNSLLLYLLLLVALAIGFLLGRREKAPTKPQKAVIRDYYQGLNFLLGERPELGVDRFIQAMEVNDESIDVHLALAGVLRRRGEVDKAIRLHQNLLASPQLNNRNKQLVELELARDYHTAGLLDRAEGLLSEIVARRGTEYDQALSLLMDLYEQEREWQKVIDVSRGLKGADQELRSRLSHIHCELGERALRQGQRRAALESVKAAINADASNPRAYWLGAEIDMLSNKHRAAIKRLNKVVELDNGLGGEVMDLYANAARAAGAEEEYAEFLRRSLEHDPDPRLLTALIDYRRKRGLDAGLHDVVTYIEQAPGGQHFSLLLELLDETDSAAQHRVRKLLSRVALTTQSHQCANCGFSSVAHIWHCPTCKQWGTFAPMRGPMAAAS